METFGAVVVCMMYGVLTVNSKLFAWRLYVFVNTTGDVCMPTVDATSWIVKFSDKIYNNTINTTHGINNNGEKKERKILL